MLFESGVNLSPDPGIWGVLDQKEEEQVLAYLYEDKDFIALMKKYAEGANKALIARVNTDQEYWKYRGQFFCYNSMIVKSRRAWIKTKKQSQLPLSLKAK